MKLQRLRKTVSRLFDAADEIVFPVQLIRKEYGSYTPGSAKTIARTSYAARLIKMKSPGGRSGLEDGPVLDKGIQLGLLGCEDAIPSADDELDIDGKRHVISQSKSLDLNAGFLFEIWYA